MDWTRLEVSGRVTAVQRGICAGVTAEGTVFTAQLRLPHLRPTTYDDLLVDSFGVLGIAPGDETWLTGRGADGRLHLWASGDDATVDAHPLSDIDAMWAAPTLDTGTELLLTAHLTDGDWRLRTFDRRSAIAGGLQKVSDLALAGSPDAGLTVGCPVKEPLVVAGRLGESGSASAWALGEGAWRRVHLAPAPTALTSVAYAWGGRHTWIGGVADGRAVVYELLPLPFRGPLRTTPVPMPTLELVALPEGRGRPLVVVDDVVGDVPLVVAAMSRGNRLCWHDGNEWKALPAPDGPLRAACVSGGAVHLLVGDSLWSIEDPLGIAG
jgi:hypothetical protein